MFGAAAPHITIADNGDVCVRLSPADAKVLTGHDLPKLLDLQDRIRCSVFVAQMEQACRSEAVT
jgi:hypothetical protein